MVRLKVKETGFIWGLEVAGKIDGDSITINLRSDINVGIGTMKSLMKAGKSM